MTFNKTRRARIKLLLALTLICLIGITYAKQGSSIVTATQYDPITGNITLTVKDDWNISQIVVYGKDNQLIVTQNYPEPRKDTQTLTFNVASTKFPLKVSVRDNQTTPAYDYWAVHTNGSCYGPYKTFDEVGGTGFPVDSLALLAPYVIGLASTAIVAAAATTVYAKRAKRKEKVQ